MASNVLKFELAIINTMNQETGYNLILVDRAVGSDFYVNNLLALLAVAREKTKEMEDIADYLGELDEIEEIVCIGANKYARVINVFRIHRRTHQFACFDRQRGKCLPPGFVGVHLQGQTELF